jgi:peptidoglycan hydrolase CwlO-like protein
MRNYLKEADLLARSLQYQFGAIKTESNTQNQDNILDEAFIKCLQLATTIKRLKDKIDDGENIVTNEPNDLEELRKELQHLNKMVWAKEGQMMSL